MWSYEQASYIQITACDDTANSILIRIDHIVSVQEGRLFKRCAIHMIDGKVYHSKLSYDKIKEAMGVTNK